MRNQRIAYVSNNPQNILKIACNFSVNVSAWSDDFSTVNGQQIWIMSLDITITKTTTSQL